MKEIISRNRTLYMREYQRQHRERYNQLAKEWRSKNREKTLRIAFNAREKLRTDALLAYGGKCACCGYADLNIKLWGRSFLEIDLVAGGHNKRMKEDLPKDTYQWLRNHHYPPGFRVLCSGCNHSMPYGAERCLLYANIT